MRINNHAVSEVVSTLLTLVVVLGVVTAVLLFGLVYMGEREILSESQTVFGGFDVMYDTMSGLIIDGYGAKGFSNIVSTNEKASLYIDSQGKKLILMYTFPDDGPGSYGPEYYDFNVSGLDDENESFTIEAQNDILDDVKIYWLDPEKITQQFPLETLSYEKIYQNHWCAQSFEPPENNWKLDKVKIYVMKRGIVSSDLNVSIYPPNATGLPDVNHPLASLPISSTYIPLSVEWIECNFSSKNIQLPSGTYYIGVNTSGGEFGNGHYNYYRWYIDKNSPYDFGGANVTDNDGSSWYPVPSYDFEYRLKFTNNTPPSTPNFQLILINYSGVNPPRKIIENETDDVDNICYRVFWGDGDNSSWTTPLLSGELQDDLSHVYAKPGTYTLKLQAKDEYGDIYEPDNVTKIYIKTGDYLPEDSYKDESPTPDPSGSGPYIWNITATEPLNGTLRIDLYNSDYHPIYLGGDLPFGRIWVFDLGSITYESPHNMGTQRTIFENGGILTSGPINNNILSPPSFFEKDNAIGFRIIQIGKSYATGGSGRGMYEIGLDMKNSHSREPRVTESNKNVDNTIYNFKMQIFDSSEEVEELWINYFTTSYDFEKIPDRPNTIYYQRNGIPFVLDSSFIEVNVEAVR